MKLVRKTRDKESREFWQFVEKTAKEVEGWPEWMKGGSTKGEVERPKQEAQSAGTRKKN
jgi:hypothetical protein